MGVWWEVPRHFFGILNALAMAWAATAALYLARNLLGASVATATAAALCVVASRFGMVFYYDYLSGTVGTIGLALFLTTTIALANELEKPNFRRSRALLVITLAIATVLTYETYIAGLFALGMGTVALAFVRRKSRNWSQSSRLALTGLAIWVLPLGIFVLATELVSTLSVMTGTAGRPVAIDLGTAQAFLQFSANVFLGTNFGHDWFVGTLSANSTWGARIGYVAATVFSALWGASFLSAAGRWSPRQIFAALTLLIIAIATIAISALPGLDRADARWMFPLSAVLPALILCFPNSLARNCLLLAVLGLNCIHLFAGNAAGVYNVRASQASGVLARAMQSVTPVAQRGIVTGMPDNELEWILGGDALQGNDVRKGDVYCWINLGGPPCIDPRSALEIEGGSRHDFSLAYAPDGDGGKAFLVSDQLLENILHPNIGLFENALTIGGDAKAWKDWNWSGMAAPTAPDATISDAGSHGTITLPVIELRGKLLGYLASSVSDNQASIRLQVNWLRADRSLISPQIEVVKPPKSPAPYTMLLIPPEDAVYGEVYATLHDSQSGAVRIHEIVLIN